MKSGGRLTSDLLESTRWNHCVVFEDGEEGRRGREEGGGTIEYSRDYSPSFTCLVHPRKELVLPDYLIDSRGGV